MQQATTLSDEHPIRYRPEGEEPDARVFGANRDSARAWVAALGAARRRAGAALTMPCDSCIVPSGALEALRRGGFAVGSAHAGVPRQPNGLVFERPEDLPLVREVAMALLAEDVPLSRIRLAFHDESNPVTGPRIRLEYRDPLREWTPLSYRQLLAMCVRGGEPPCGTSPPALLSAGQP
jgi:hypothetical protein